ncbi:MAG TPA: hypothetical protein VKS82_27215 [Streptosporangiaceae bacterium]|jgi:hypothetical protein|nr:hypothetical protein [Streptosporangiaceae bacterium]
MFIAGEARLEVDFPIATARLEDLARGSSLASVSGAAYGGVPGVSGLVSVSFLDLVVREDSVVLGVRWNAAGPGGALFPALDANIILTADGERATVLRLEGAYRAFPGELDSVTPDQMATATIRSFVAGLARAIACPAGTAGAGQPGD